MTNRRNRTKKIRESADELEALEPQPIVIQLPASSTRDLPVAARALLAILGVLPPWSRIDLLLALIGLAIITGSGLGWW